jgi:VCBS repeat protein
MKRHTILMVACMFLVACLTLFGKAFGSASDGKSSQVGGLASAAKRVVVQAAGRGNPYINFEDGIEISASYEGAPEMQSLMKQDAAEPRALASADFDEDGVPDLICGYARKGGGIVTLYRGNVDSIYQNSPEAQRRKAEGTFTDSAFLSPARVFEAPIAGDFVGAGDLDADGHWDVVVAARGGKELYLLAGDGKGSFLGGRSIAVTGEVISLITGEINRADGLTDVVVGVVAGDGPKVLVFEGAEGALKAKPEVFTLPGEPRALALGQFDDEYTMDLVVGAGSELVIVHGRDRKLSLDQIRQAEVPAARLERRSFGFEIRAMAAGDFTGQDETSLALLATDGTVCLSPIQVGESEPTVRKSIKTLIMGKWHGASSLVCSRVSTGPADDLLLLSEQSRQISILKTGMSQSTGSSASAGARVSASLDVEGEPVALLPMRLNADALSDLVILQAGHSAPAVSKTASGTTFTVNKEDAHNDGVCDSDDCTMIEAIVAADTNPGADTIAFNMPGAGPHFVVSHYPVSDPVTIDGTTQPGFNGTPLMFLTGGFSVPLSGLTISAGNSVVQGVGLVRHVRSGIELNTNGGNIIQGNFIGTRGPAINEYRNLAHGVLITSTSTGNLIGGTTAAARNVISTNRFAGVRFEGNASSNVVQGNFIGTDASGSMGAYFQGAGIWFTNNTTANNIIGGTTPGARNLISGNGSWGVLIAGAGNNLIQGNFIGTDVNGGFPIHNGSGVVGSVGSNATIGGTTPSARNVISGNQADGILVSSMFVQGNYIGTDFTGLAALPNQFGIRVFGSGNSIGGVPTGASNTVRFNTDGGVVVPSGTDNLIRGNSIFANGGLGIDLGGDGVTLNDGCDVDVGANNLQNHPAVTSANSGPVGITIQGDLKSTPNSTFTVEFFTNTACHASGFGEGQALIGSALVTTDANCNASFNITLSVSVAAGQFITATATDAGGNTSEFSQCVRVQPSPFDLCVQDESNGNILLLNSTTGAYQFTNCRGTLLSGIGSLIKKGCLVTLQVNGPDRRILARIDTCAKTGSVSIQLLTQGTSFSILDRNTSNNTCACVGTG